MMEQGIRPDLVYEELGQYQKPPLMAVREKADPAYFGPFLPAQSRPAMLVAGLFSRAVGFDKFMRDLRESLEERLRKTNLRLPGLFAPMISATAALEDDPRSPGVFLRAASLVWAARSLRDDLWTGTLPQDFSKGRPLEMGQYANLFGTSLVVGRTEVRVSKTSEVDRILVLVRGRFYILDITGLGDSLSLAEFARMLESLSDSQASSGAEPLDSAPGVLTSVSTPTQLKAFRQLEASALNRESLQQMRHTLLTLCLDLDDQPGSHEESARFAHSRNYHNRWFHSSFQLVVFGDSKACGIFSFTAYVDGNVMTRAGDEIVRRARSAPLDRIPGIPVRQASAPLALRFEISPELSRGAVEEFEKFRDHQQATYVVEGIGRETFEQHGLNAVQVFVVALAQAVRKLIGHCANIEQFLSMSGYRCMDLVAPNMTTPLLISFVERMGSGAIDSQSAAGELRQVCGDLEEVCRNARRFLPFPIARGLFVASRTRGQRMAGKFMLLLPMLLLRFSGQARRHRREVVISHPAIFPGIPILGRPGVRLPYAKCFGLHYQIFERRTVVTVMPGVTWPISNEELIGELKRCLTSLEAVLNDAASGGRRAGAA